jgi:hypothetical protein
MAPVSHDERAAARSLLRRIAQTPLGDRMILAASSGLYTASEGPPALTEDLDFLVDADWWAVNEALLLAQLEALGFQHQPGTCTFLADDGTSLDLVGYSTLDAADRIGGGSIVPVMVYGDLSVLVGSGIAVVEPPAGGRALSPAALAALKLLTVRVEKGRKDKIQGLLLIDENGNSERFVSELRRLLGRFDSDRLRDAVADAQAAFLAISGDRLRGDPQLEGYAPFRTALERGLTLLQRLSTGETT